MEGFHQRYLERHDPQSFSTPLQGSVRGADPIRVDPTQNFAFFTAWQLEAPNQWVSELWRLALDDSELIQVPTDTVSEIHGDGWLWYFDTDWATNSRYFAADWLRPTSVLCAFGNPVDLHWKDISNVGLPTGARVGPISLFPSMTDTLVVSAFGRGLFAREFGSAIPGAACN